MIASKYIGMDSMKQSPDLDSPGLFSDWIKSYNPSGLKVLHTY